MNKIEKNTDGKKKWVKPKLLKLDQKETEGGFTKSTAEDGQYCLS